MSQTDKLQWLQEAEAFRTQFCASHYDFEVSYMKGMVINGINAVNSDVGGSQRRRSRVSTTPNLNSSGMFGSKIGSKESLDSRDQENGIHRRTSSSVDFGSKSNLCSIPSDRVVHSNDTKTSRDSLEGISDGSPQYPLSRISSKSKKTGLYSSGSIGMLAMSNSKSKPSLDISSPYSESLDSFSPEPPTWDIDDILSSSSSNPGGRDDGFSSPPTSPRNTPKASSLNSKSKYSKKFNRQSVPVVTTTNPSYPDIQPPSSDFNFIHGTAFLSRSGSSLPDTLNSTGLLESSLNSTFSKNSILIKATAKTAPFPDSCSPSSSFPRELSIRHSSSQTSLTTSPTIDKSTFGFLSKSSRLTKTGSICSADNIVMTDMMKKDPNYNNRQYHEVGMDLTTFLSFTSNSVPLSSLETTLEGNSSGIGVSTGTVSTTGGGGPVSFETNPKTFLNQGNVKSRKSMDLKTFFGGNSNSNSNPNFNSKEEK